ncbi:organic cation transporter protein-like isoform X2 [Varroa destructor]|uniref:Major facilitator superfamily (MFS) profile domain-containing protein n=1 Tax=Varroa destructor TaxID=109461 RepID=A0A7M7K4J4_VARDE|nr:organic cation transporter protein-like isoform X2 [Varroa destructor]
MIKDKLMQYLRKWKHEGIPEGDHCHRFVLNRNGSINQSIIEPCEHWSFNTTLLSSSVAEFNLVCERSWQKSAIQSVVFVAQIFGALLIGKLSDRIGRLPSYTWSTALFVLFGFIASFAPSVAFFNVLRFIQCVCIAGLNTSISTFYTEVSLAEHRSLLNVGFALGFQIPMLFSPSLAGFLHSWRGVQMAMGLSAVPLLPFFCILQESPRWLLTKGQPARSRRALENILRFNKQDVSVLDNLPLSTGKILPKQVGVSLADMLKTSAYRNTVLALFSLWFLDQAAFFSAIYLSTRIPGDRPRNFACTAAAGVAGGAGAIVLLRFVSRKSSVGGFLIISSCAFIALAVLPQDSAEWLHLIAAMLLRFSIVTSTGIIWTYTLEIFPTIVRNFGFSCCFCFGRIGGTIAPFMRDLGEWYHCAPYFVLAAACIGAGLSLPFLPETLNAPLPDNLADIRTLNKDNVVPSNHNAMETSHTAIPLVKS